MRAVRCERVRCIFESRVRWEANRSRKGHATREGIDMHTSGLRGMRLATEVMGTHAAERRSLRANRTPSFLALIAMVAVLCVGGRVQASPVVYTLNTLTGINGSQLNGTITVNDADNNGAIVASEIVAWSFTSTGPITFAFSSATASAGFQLLSTPGSVSATPTELSFNFGSLVPNDPFMSFFAPGVSLQLLTSAQGGVDPVVWNQGVPPGERGHWPTNVIATASVPVEARSHTWAQIKRLYR